MRAQPTATGPDPTGMGIWAWQASMKACEQLPWQTLQAMAAAAAPLIDSISTSLIVEYHHHHGHAAI